MTTFKKYTGVPTITMDYNWNSGYLKDNNGTDLYLGFENGDSFIGNIDNFNENSATTNTAGCYWRIDRDNTDDITDDTNTGRKIFFDIDKTTESRLIEFKYDSIVLFKIYLDASDLIPIEFEMSVGFAIEQILVEQLDNATAIYDTYVRTKYVTLSNPLPFELNVCVLLVYDSTYQDGTIDLHELIEGYDYSFDAYYIDGIPYNNDKYRPSVTMHRGNGGYGFHSIVFLDSYDLEHRCVGPDSSHNPTDEYADILFENKIYRCTNINVESLGMIY